METLIIIIGIILLLAGIVGCIIPALPGPVLAYLSLVVLQFTPDPPFTLNFLIIWALVISLITLLDYVIPIYGTKKFGGSKSGVNGSIIGAIIGFLFLPPLGLILGPFIGALVGELLAGKNSHLALKAAIGSFIGFLAGIFMKIIVVLIVSYHFFSALIG